MQILFVADPLESFQTYKDTTFAMMREAQRRGHSIVACEPRQLSWQRGGKVVAQVRHIQLTGDARQWFEISKEGLEELAGFDAILMRKDPPFDMAFVNATYTLELAEAQGCLVSTARRACATATKNSSSAAFRSAAHRR